MKKFFAALAVAAIASTALLGTAEASHKRHFGFHGHHHKIWIGSSCHWLKRKAIRSGKHYWWKRYWRCVSHDYDF